MSSLHYEWQRFLPLHGRGDLFLLFPLPGKTQVNSSRERNDHRDNSPFQSSTITCCSSLQVHHNQQNHLQHHPGFTGVERKNEQSGNHDNIFYFTWSYNGFTFLAGWGRDTEVAVSGVGNLLFLN